MYPGGGRGNPLQCSRLENPMAEEPGGRQSIGSQRVYHNWSNLACTYASLSKLLSHLIWIISVTPTQTLCFCCCSPLVSSPLSNQSGFLATFLTLSPTTVPRKHFYGTTYVPRPLCFPYVLPGAFCHMYMHDSFMLINLYVTISYQEGLLSILYKITLPHHPFLVPLHIFLVTLCFFLPSLTYYTYIFPWVLKYWTLIIDSWYICLFN